MTKHFCFSLSNFRKFPKVLAFASTEIQTLRLAVLWSQKNLKKKIFLLSTDFGKSAVLDSIKIVNISTIKVITVIVLKRKKI